MDQNDLAHNRPDITGISGFIDSAGIPVADKFEGGGILFVKPGDSASTRPEAIAYFLSLSGNDRFVEKDIDGVPVPLADGSFPVVVTGPGDAICLSTRMTERGWVAIDGASWSQLENVTSHEAVVAQIVDRMRPFDGIPTSWEFPNGASFFVRTNGLSGHRPDRVSDTLDVFDLMFTNVDDTGVAIPDDDGTFRIDAYSSRDVAMLARVLEHEGWVVDRHEPIIDDADLK